MISRLEGSRDALRDARQSLDSMLDLIVADEPIEHEPIKRGKSPLNRATLSKQAAG